MKLTPSLFNPFPILKSLPSEHGREKGEPDDRRMDKPLLFTQGRSDAHLGGVRA